MIYISSIFKKQFVVYLGTLFISFLFTGAVLTGAFGSYFTEQKKQMLVEQGEKISNVFKQAYYWGGLYDKDKLNNEIQILDEYLDASFIYVDTDFSVLMISNDIDPKWLGQSLPLYEVKSVIEKGEIVETQGHMGEIFEKPVITVGYPVIIEDKTTGAIFMNSPMTELEMTMEGAYKIIASTMLVFFFVGFVIVYFSSKKISKPLMEINNAAKVISSGDFEKRIVVSGKDEVAQLAQSFNDMAESLYEQERRRREFISNISHDLRSPLTSMHGFLQAIIDGTIPDEKKEHYLNIVLDETERLATLANNIININKLDDDGDELKPSAFNLNELITKTVYSFETRAINKNLNLKIVFATNETYVYADYEKIQRVIYNLLDNAIKFTDLGGEITITTTIKDKKVYVSVKDNGRGISKKSQKRIFDRFYKADVSRGEDKKGSGLGLSIVKHFIRAHGETITLNSDPGKGCEFIFTLSLIKKY